MSWYKIKKPGLNQLLNCFIRNIIANGISYTTGNTAVWLLLNCFISRFKINDRNLMIIEDNQSDGEKVRGGAAVYENK